MNCNNSQKIIHVSTFYNKGGSGRSAYRIHSGLIRNSFDSKMLVKHLDIDEKNVYSISGGIVNLIDKFLSKILNLLSLNDMFFLSTIFLKFNYYFKSSNIIQLYNLHGNYFGLAFLPFIAKNKIIVLRLSDMWSFTGHCSYSYDCEKWKIGCGKCPYLNEYPKLKYDNTKLLWKLKKIIFGQCNKLHIVAPSKWIKKISEESPIFSNAQFHYIPNGIDTDIFSLKFRNDNKDTFKNKNNKVVMFISESFDEDYRKGSKYFIEALNILKNNYDINISILIVGKTSEKNQIPYNVIYKGFLKNNIELRDCYCNSDILVLPTLAENLPNTILESMACGTPVVGFNIGGLPDAIKHMKNGYLANYKDSNDLARGIYTILSNEKLLKKMSLKSNRLIEKEFTVKNEIDNFIKLYDSIN